MIIHRFRYLSSKIIIISVKNVIPCDDPRKSRIKKEYFGRGPDAEKAARKRHDELGLKKRRPARGSRGPKFSELAYSYADNKNFSKNSKDLLSTRLRSNILPHLGNFSGIQIRYQDLDNYVKKRRRDRVKDSTIARELTDIKAILNWSVARQLLEFNPIRDYKKPAENNELIIPPDTEEISKILKHASPHLIRVIMLSYYLGLRPGAVELLRITWSNILWESRAVLIKSADKGGPKNRLVPIHDNFLPILSKWHAEDKNIGYLIHFHGQPIKSIKRAWRGALRRAKIKRRLRPYDLRHHFVTKALEEGADLKALSEVVGSRPETIMKYYQHVTSEVHRKTVAKIPGLPILEND